MHLHCLYRLWLRHYVVAGVGAIDIICGIRNKGIPSSAGGCCWVRCHCHWNISFRQCAYCFGASFENNPCESKQMTGLTLLQQDMSRANQ